MTECTPLANIHYSQQQRLAGRKAAGELVFQPGGISVISLDHQVVLLKKSMGCLWVKYAHDTIGYYSRSSVKNVCYAMYRGLETNKCAYVLVCICMCVRKSGILVLLVYAILLGCGSIHLESHMRYRWRLLSFANLDMSLVLFFLRVINAGKSTHNEDQASCEVLFVKKKAGGANSTPNKNSSTKRRSSLPNGEGLQLKDNSVSRLLYLVSGEVQNKYKRAWQFDTKICLLHVLYIFSYLLLIISA